jgi:hypothetical protein
LGGGPGQWRSQQVALRGGDLLLLAAGFGGTGLGEPSLAAELERAVEADESSTGVVTVHGCARTAELLGQRLAAVAAGQVGEEARRKARWYLHSRVAIAVVRVAAAQVIEM